MEILQNTLYVLSQGAYLSKDHETIRVEVNNECKLSLPLHHIETVVVFGQVSVSPFVLHACAERGIAVTFLSESGRLLARVDAPCSGSVALRRIQNRRADGSGASLEISRRIVGGKIQNARQLFLRAGRESTNEAEKQLDRAAEILADVLPGLATAQSVDAVRGLEGYAASQYFGSFPLLIKQQQKGFEFSGRTRRPPRDRVNALLSFCYALLLNDCVAALTAVGLDPSIGFLHEDRSGRPSLALDLMEEFRPLIADRLVLKLINKRLISSSDLSIREGGAVELTERGRRTVISEYQQRKREELKHPILEQNTRIGLLPFLQAKLLAKHLREEIEYYPPCVIR